MQGQFARQRCCALLGIAANEQPVWASRGAVFFQCPESLMTGKLWYWLNLAGVFRHCPVRELIWLPAIDVDAMQVIWEEEKKINENR